MKTIWNYFGEMLVVVAIVVAAGLTYNVVKYGEPIPPKCEQCGGSLQLVANGQWLCPNIKASFPEQVHGR